MPNAGTSGITLPFRFGGYQTETSVHTRALRVLAAELETRLGGAAQVAVTANVADLGRKAVDLLTMVAQGEVDLCYFASSYVDPAQAPALGLLDLPFLVTDRARVYAQLDGALGARVAEEVAHATPYRVLGFWDNGFRHLSNGVRPIRGPADCRGLRLRTTTSALHQEIFASYGFVPVVVDPAKLAEAVQTGVVEAQENPLANLVQFGIYRTHRYVSLTSHFFGCALLLVNRAWHDRLPASARTALEESASAATQAQRRFAIEEDARCLDLLTREGVEIIPAEAVDRGAFQAASASIVAREARRIGPALLADWQG